jgi:hypothetical protein
LAFYKSPAIPKGVSNKNELNSESGLTVRSFTRLHLPTKMPYNGLSLEDMSVSQDEKPYSVEKVLSFGGSDNPQCLKEYSGTISINEAGIYQFATDSTGATRLFIDHIEICRSKVLAPHLPGKIELDVGIHRYRLMVAQAKATVQITSPGSENAVTAPIGMFKVNPQWKVSDNGRLIAGVVPSIGEKGKLTLEGDAQYTKAYVYNAEIVDGRKGKAIKLNGGLARLEFENLSSPEDAFSLSCWMKINKTTDCLIMDNSRLDNPGASLRHLRGYALFYRGSERAEFDLQKELGRKVKLGEDWIHIAISYGKTVRTFINGRMTAEKPKQVPNMNAHARTKKLFYKFNGCLEDVKLFNKTLNENDVKELMR